MQKVMSVYTIVKIDKAPTFVTFVTGNGLLVIPISCELSCGVKIKHKVK